MLKRRSPDDMAAYFGEKLSQKDETITTLRAQVAKWKAYAERLEEVGDTYFVAMPGPDDVWNEARATRPDSGEES